MAKTLAEMIAARGKAPVTTAPATNATLPIPAVPTAMTADQLFAQRAGMLAASKPKTRRNDIPDGVGYFLIKNGYYKITDKNHTKLSIFALYCVKGVSDAQGFGQDSPGYTGPKQGEIYETAIFHEGEYPQINLDNMLRVFAACTGCTVAEAVECQKTPDGAEFVRNTLRDILCVDMAFRPTNAPCMVANQCIVEISKTTGMKDVKDKTTKKVVYDETGKKIQKPQTNIFWNKRVWLTDPALGHLTEADIIKAFGTMEAFTAAAELEAKLLNP